MENETPTGTSLTDITNYPWPILPGVLHRTPPRPNASTAWQFLWWLTTQHLGQLTCAVALAWLSFTAPLVAAYYLRFVIDDGFAAHDPTATVTYSLYVVAALVVAVLAALSRHFVMSVLRNKVRCLIIRTLTHHCTHTGAALTRKVGAGELATIQAVDLSALGHVMTAIGPGLAGALTILAAAIYLTSTSVPLAVALLGGTVTLSVLVIPFVRRAKQANGVVRSVTGALNDRSYDLVHGLRVLTGIGGRTHFAADFRRESRAVQHASCAVAPKTVGPLVLKDTNGLLLMTFVLAVMVWVATQHDLSAGRVAELVGYSTLLLTPMDFINAGISRISAGLVAADRVVRVLSVQPDFNDATSPQSVTVPAAPVVPNVTEATLHDPESNVTLTPGRSFAVVGDRVEIATIFAALAHYRNSKVTWGPVPLTDIALPVVRANVLYAEQHSFIFPGRFDEVVQGSKPPDADWLAHVIHAAHLADVVEPRGGAHTAHVATSGRNFSGGQVSRIRLARALYAAPPVLLLDHPTHAVDATTEAAIADRVLDLRAGHTTCVASNAPAWHHNVDHVIVIHDGKVACEGAFDQIKHNPQYHVWLGRNA